MRASQVLSIRFTVQKVGPALARLATRVVTAIRRSCSREDAIVSRYEGRAWCDETERDMANDIANWRCTRL